MQPVRSLKFQFKRVEILFRFGPVSNSVRVGNSIWFRVANSGSNVIWVTKRFMLLISGRFVTSNRVTNSGYNYHYKKNGKTKIVVEIP